MKLPLPTRPTRTSPSDPPRPKKPAPPRIALTTARTRLAAPAPLWTRPLLMGALFAALLIAVAAALLTLAGGVEMRSLEQHRSDSDTAATEASSVAQSFHSPRPNLSALDVELGTYVSLPADGRIRLLRGEGTGGEPVYETLLNTANFDRNPYLALRFPPIAASAGETYTLVLETPGRPLKAAIGLRYSTLDTMSAGSRYIDGEVAEGDLAMSVYYRYDLWTLWGDTASTLAGYSVLLFSWSALLLLPGLTLLTWLPNGLSWQQRALAAPGLSALALPVVMLLTRALNVRLGTLAMWLLLLLCAGAIALWWYRHRPTQAIQNPGALRATKIQNREDWLFWGLLSGVFLITLAARLLSLRDAVAGMGLDAYHHTLIARMFVEQGGIPSDYHPYADLVSFTYHYGFHALVASVGWLSGLTSPDDMLTLMPQAGQIATALAVPALALFAWRVLGDRWAGLAAGTLAGLVSIFPAFYVNWSRYTQGLGLALLPVAWVLLLEALKWRANPLPAASQKITFRDAAGQSGPFMLAVIGAAGLALTHYRVAMIFAGFTALYLFSRLLVPGFWFLVRPLYSRTRNQQPGTSNFGPRWAEAMREVWGSVVLALLTVSALSPWLLNLAGNFGSRFVGRDSPVAEGYYSLENMLGGNLLYHPSLPIIVALSFGGLVWAAKRRDTLPLLPALTWIVLGIWSNPYLLPVRLPYSGYLDATTLATSAWLPLTLLAGYTLSQAATWTLSLGDAYSGARRRVWRMAAGGALGLATLACGLAVALPTAAMLDSKPYLAPADREALIWMRGNLPRDSYILANPFAFPWDAPPQAIQGSDAGLWAPLVAGVRASVPPIPAYNERLGDPKYLDNIRTLIRYEPFAGEEADWDALRSAGITHIYAGSRGGALSVPDLLQSDQVEPVFHLDAVWVFALR